MDDNIRKILENSDAFRHRRFKILDDGRLQVGGVEDSSRIFDSPRDAMQYLHKTGLSRVNVYDQSAGLLGMPSNGPLYNEWFERIIAKHNSRGHRIVQESYHIDSAARQAELNNIVFRGGKSYGLLIPDAGVTNLVRVFDKRGRELTEGRVKRFLHVDASGKQKALAKAPKRLKALTSERFMQASFNKTLKVGTYDVAQGLNKSRDKALIETLERSEEGMSILNPATAQKIVDSMKERASDIERLAGTHRTKEAVSGRRNAAAMRRKIGELEDSISNGGRFNVRGMGLEVRDLKNKELQMAFGRLITGQIKGDTIIGQTKHFAKGGKYAGFDIVTALHNIKQEANVGQDIMSSLITLDPHHTTTNVFTDIQSLIAHNEMFPVERLEEYSSKRIEQFTRNLMDKGEIPKGMIDSLRDTLSMEAPSLEGITVREADDLMIKFSERKAFARRVIDMYDAGIPLSSDPAMVKTLLDNFMDQFDRTKAGAAQPHLMVPDAIRGYILGEKDARESLNPVNRILAPGQATFDERLGWILHKDTIAEQYETFGGWDKDDAIVGAVRWDKKGKRLVVMPWRSPTEFGEASMFTMADDDSSAAMHILRQRGAHTEADDLLAYDRQIRKLNRSRERAADIDIVDRQLERLRLDRQAHIEAHIENVDDAEVLLNRSKHTKRLGAAVKNWEGQAAKRIRDLPTDYTNRQASRIMETIVANAGLLERTSNLGLVMDTFLNQSFDDILPEHRVLKVGMEKVIDAIVNPGSSDLAGQLPTALDEMAYAFGRAMKAAGGGIDPHWVNVDKRVSGDILDRITQGWISLGGDPEEMILSETDERSIMSRYMRRQTDFLATEAEGVRDVWRNAKFIDAIQEGTWTETEKDDARKLIDRLNTLRDEAEDLKRGGQIVDDDMLEIGSYIADNGPLPTDKESLLAMTEYFDDTGKPGKRFARTMGAAMQMVHDEGGDPGLFVGTTGKINMSDLRTWAIAYLHSDGFTKTVGSKRYQETLRRLSREDYSASTIEEGISHIPGMKKSVAAGVADSASRFVAGSGKYARMSFDSVANLMRETSSLKKGAMVGLALAAFSEIYQRNKDRSPEEMEGPPLLPGGSFYEGMPSEGLPPVNFEYIAPQNQGVTYQISGRGGNADSIRSQAEMMTGANSSGTMYNTLQPVVDVLSEIDGTF